MTVKLNVGQLSEHYLAALRTHLAEGPRARLQPAALLGREAFVLGLETLELARIHQHALAVLELPATKNGTFKRAEIFFNEANSLIEETPHRAHTEEKGLIISPQRLGGGIGAVLVPGHPVNPKGIKPKAIPKYRPKKTAGVARPSATASGTSRSFPVIAMAASVGGLKALSVILGGLPADFPAAIAIVMHLAPDHKSILAEILNSRSHLPVTEAHNGDLLLPARVFVAPPNHHLSVAKDGRLKLSSAQAEKIHFARPSAEPLFATVAQVYKKNAIAVVLTGGDGDGSFGVQIIKDKCGTVIAQDRPTSENFSMPETSIKTGDVDFILPLDEIAPTLIALVWGSKKSTGCRPIGKGRMPAPALAKTIQSAIHGQVETDSAARSERGVHAASTSEPKGAPVSGPGHPILRMVKRRERRAPAAAPGNHSALTRIKDATPHYAASRKAVMLKHG